MPIETITQDPAMLAAVVAAGAGAAGVLAYKKFADKQEETIETEGMKTKFKKIFEEPTKTQGSKVKDFVKMRGTSNTPQLIGYAYKAKDNDIKTVTYNVEEKEYQTQDSIGTTYTILEGRKKTGLYIKAFLHSLAPGNTFAETYDVPEHLIMPGDDYIWFSNEAHFVKFNGIKRQFSVEGLSRGWEASFAKTHENYLKTKGDIPEQYATLNNRISGQLKMENIRSENIREYKKEQDRSEKDL